MPVPNRTLQQAKYSEQNIANYGFDEDYGVPAVEQLGHDGQNMQRQNADALATKITTSGLITYLGIAAPGTTQATAKWQCQKIDSTDANNIVITWAGGGAFNQTATDLTANTYV